MRIRLCARAVDKTRLGVRLLERQMREVTAQSDSTGRYLLRDVPDLAGRGVVVVWVQ